MDAPTYGFMEDFVTTYITKTGLKVCDVGSRDINGSYRPLFENQFYTGIDIVPGKNVDVVVEPYRFPFPDGAFDVVVSGQTLEHVEDIYAWMQEVARISKDLVCIIAPWKFKEHRFPVDCWRILPDGMSFLFKRSGLRQIHIELSGASCIGIAKKEG